MKPFAEVELRDPAGEPVDLRRTLLAHGAAALPPAALDKRGCELTVALATASRPRTIRTSSGGAVTLPSLADSGPPPDAAETAALTAVVRRMLCLDDDLSTVYERALRDPRLAWAGAGALLVTMRVALVGRSVKTLGQIAQHSPLGESRRRLTHRR